MHRALEIDEIIRLICEQLQLENNFRSARRNLLRLSLTCKAIKEVALDNLWAINTEVTHIFHPFIAWGILHYEDDILQLVRHVTYMDWKRYEPYATRVTEINWDHETRVSEQACLALLASRPDTTIFTKIRSLEIWSFSGIEWLTSSIFHSQSLRSLDVYAETFEASEILPSFLANIGSGSVNLQVVALSILSGEMWANDLPQQVASSFISFPQLREFSLTAPSSFVQSFFNSSPPLTHLRKLNLVSTHSDEEEVMVPTVTSQTSQLVGLTGLTELSFVSHSTAMDLDTFRQLATHAPLKSVDIEFEGRFTPQDVDFTLRCLHNCVWNSVESVVLSADGGWSNFSQDPVNGEHLRPLSHPTFASLKTLDIGGFFPFEINDLELGLFRWRCPLLESLHLRSYTRGPPRVPPSTTLAGLISLGTTLPNLKHLTLPVMVDPTNLARELVVQTSTMISWDPSYSTAVNPFVAVSALLNNFPYLESVSPHPRLASTDSDLDDEEDNREEEREREREWIKSGEGFEKMHEFIQTALKIRMPGESTRDAAKRLFG